MPDDFPHTIEKKPLEAYKPEKGDKPPKEDIPVALEYKLDVIIARLNRMTGLVDPPDVGPFPDPLGFDPSTDPFPAYEDIPASLEWKLDTQIVFLDRIWNAVLIVAIICAAGFVAVIGWLIAIWLALGNLFAGLGLLIGLLATIAFLLAFITIRFIMPLMRRLHI